MNLTGLVFLLLTAFQGHHAMGFDESKSVHHFLMTTSGGHIEVTARDASDAEMVAAIQEHLSRIAVRFKQGDFSIPMRVHSELPPGARNMKNLKDRIDYDYGKLPEGGRITITTKDRDALKAIHEYFRYQITEHKTGDSLIPKS